MEANKISEVLVDGQVESRVFNVWDGPVVPERSKEIEDQFIADVADQTSARKIKARPIAFSKRTEI